MLVLPLKDDGEQSETSRDVFRADQIPTEGDVETPDASIFSNQKKKQQ